MTDRLMSMKEVAAESPVSRATVYREMDAGKIAYVQIRSRRFVWRSELERYIRDAQRTRTGVG